jgi:FdhD protein
VSRGAARRGGSGARGVGPQAPARAEQPNHRAAGATRRDRGALAPRGRRCPEAIGPVDVVRVRGARRHRGPDAAAREEPMEIQLGGEPFAVIMRTPGADRELVAGFLFAEQLIRRADEIVRIDYCRDPLHGEHQNVLRVDLAGPLPAERLAERRQVATNSSCGLCGRVTLRSLVTVAPRPSARWKLAAEVVRRLPGRLRRAQTAFAATGGLHAAALFDPRGRLTAIAEDVGRHNAVDKIVGRMLLEGRLPLSDRLLMVSGRASFEIVQKAFLAGLPIVAAVSAPSTLAIDLARQAGITLLGFVRGPSFNVYTHPFRLAP